MRKLFVIAVVATALMLDNGLAQAGLRHRGGCGGCDTGCGSGGCGGGHRHLGHRHGGGCSTCAAPAPCGGCGAPACAAAGGCGGCAMAMASDVAPATMVVTLPEDATLTVDGTVTTSTSSERVLVTPDLQTGQTFQYTLTAQVMRAGSMQTVTRQVTVRGGEEIRVNLELPVNVASR